MLLGGLRDPPNVMSQWSLGSLSEALPSPRQGELETREPRLRFTS